MNEDASDASMEELSEIEKSVLVAAVEKLNHVYIHGRGESLTADELSVLSYWKDRGKVKAVAPAPFGEIYQVEV
ncbi:MAG: hypothetical protein ACYC7D_10695 [Nitrososphaerales archaeon]